MLSVIESWFTPVTPSQDYRRSDYILLTLILAVGVWVRFWHLDNVGLHGDEDIMGLAARGIVAHGIPILPSDMLYLRAPVHTYLIAGSTMLFGDSEWSLRMPSAIVGSVCGLLAFLLGKRFLDPKPNLMFVAVITFLPAMIEISQTARMYVFFVATLLVFGIVLFRWERQRTVKSWLLVCLVLAVAIQFHRLAVFAAPLMLYPGLANRSWRQLLLGVIAVPGAAAMSELIGFASHLSYPEEADRLALEAVEQASPFALVFQGNLVMATAIAVGLMAAVVTLCTIGIDRWKRALPGAVTLALGVAACATLNYHIGAIALLFGAIAWSRAVSGNAWRLLVIGAAVGLLAIFQYQLLNDTGEFPGRKIIGAYVGTPSIWPTLQLMAFSPVAAALLVSSAVLAAWHSACNRPIPIYFLFFAFAVWVPVAAIGLFTWYAAPRYTIGPLVFFLLSSLAAGMYLIQACERCARLMQRRAIVTIGGIAIVVAMVNPVAAWQVARNDYGIHPDHKGAAEFIEGLHLGESDIVIAEDSIVQTYYVGKVDYRLQSIEGARNHSVLRDGVLFGQYTGTPVIGSGKDLELVFDRNDGRRVYVISSEQGSDDLQRRNRGSGIAEVLSSDRLDVAYVGRDRRTTVWELRH